MSGQFSWWKIFLSLPLGFSHITCKQLDDFEVCSEVLLGVIRAASVLRLIFASPQCLVFPCGQWDHGLFLVLCKLLIRPPNPLSIPLILGCCLHIWTALWAPNLSSLSSCVVQSLWPPRTFPAVLFAHKSGFSSHSYVHESRTILELTSFASLLSGIIFCAREK